jgi:pyrroline-5-carboxylate reductase
VKIGFIGCGNMGSAIIKALVKKYSSEYIYISDLNAKALEEIQKKYKVNVGNNYFVVQNSDIIFLAVKPNVYHIVLNEIKELSQGKVIISMAAGKSISDVQMVLGQQKIVRIMPNTPALVGEAMTAVTFNNLISSTEKETVRDILTCFGKLEEVEEKYMSAVTAISGSSPAYIYMVIEAMADAGVLLGLPRQKAYAMAAQSVLGSAKMVLESGELPAKLKDNVCSPGGTTIEAVRKLEEKGLRSTFIEAIVACYEKAENMSK